MEGDPDSALTLSTNAAGNDQQKSPFRKERAGENSDENYFAAAFSVAADFDSALASLPASLSEGAV